MESRHGGSSRMVTSLCCTLREHTHSHCQTTNCPGSKLWSLTTDRLRDLHLALTACCGHLCPPSLFRYETLARLPPRLLCTYVLSFFLRDSVKVSFPFHSIFRHIFLSLSFVSRRWKFNPFPLETFYLFSLNFYYCYYYFLSPVFLFDAVSKRSRS